MTATRRSALTLGCLTALLLGATPLAGPQAARAPAGQEPPLFKSGVELVTVNLVVRDRQGRVVRGLTQDDFTIVEDGRPQTIQTFDSEQLDTPAAPVTEAAPSVPILATPSKPALPPTPSLVPMAELHDRRLLVFFFDLSSMQPEEIERAVGSARDYVEKRLAPADLIAVVSLATSLQVEQDFTADRDQLLKVLGTFGRAGGQGFEEGATGDTSSLPDAGTAFTPDETEFNIFNTDRRLEALRSLADALSGVQQKKSVVYFSSGMSRTGQDNQVELRTVVDRAVRANVSIYAADMRGLQAIVPGGEAQQASVRGVSAYSGQALQGQFDRTFASQEALATLAEDTGGRAFFDSNDFGPVFDRVVADTSAYYVLGYQSTNLSRNGRFRRIEVRTKLPNVSLEYRKGYYAGKDWAHASRQDREQQLQDQLLSPISATDLSVYLSTSYFRLDKGRYYVPITLVVPGSEIPFTTAGDTNRATLDILGLMRDEQQRPVGRIRDTVKLSVGEGEQVRRKSVQYQSGFQLPPGKYHLKVVLRENQDGVIGSYETDVIVPDLGRDPVKVSTVVFGTQVRTNLKPSEQTPLARAGEELVPNLAHVVSTAQPLRFYYEVYDPAQAKTESGDAKVAQAAGGRIRLLTNVALFRGGVRVFETPVAEATGLNAADRRAVVFQVMVPPATLQPGYYVCQVNVIDDVAGTFAFPRLALYVRR
jgi:VWFA-related protein